MDQQTDLSTMLALIRQPAFSVCKGCITLCNSAAERLLLTENTPISQLSEDCEYEQLTDGCLFLTLNHNGFPLEASVTRVGDHHIFVIDADGAQPELKAYALASTVMRQPLSSAISLVRSIENQAIQPDCDKFAQLKQHLWQVHRILCNMTDAKYYSDGGNHMICQNITSVAEELFLETQRLLQQSGIQFSYQIPREDILCQVDSQLLERAVYNMISNAVKFSNSSEPQLKASLACRNKRLYLSVTNQGTGIDSKEIGNVFNRYTREPGIEDIRNGIGLGMAMVRYAAKAHNGTVLFDRPTQGETRVTLSFPVSLARTANVASQTLNVDYAGGWEHGLLELCDILPPDLYSST